MGVSGGQYSEYLNTIEINSEFVPFTELNLEYLSAANWDNYFFNNVQQALLVTMQSFDSTRRQLVSSGKNINELQFKVEYTSLEGREPTSFVNVAHWAKCMDNIKANVPRTAYHGIVSLYVDGLRMHLVPK